MQLLQVCATATSDEGTIHADNSQRICIDEHYFDRDYYENGPQTGKSLYENYHYIPERSEPTARYLAELYLGKTILDFGCAKGFLVKALREIGVKAYGYDISKYAVDHCIPEASLYLYRWLSSVPKCDVVVGKDVLEHIPHLRLPKTLETLARKYRQGLFVVPLGDNGKYRIECYHKDPSHIVIENESFWYRMFVSCGWKVERMNCDISHFKAHWAKEHPQGNAVFYLSSKYLFD